MLPALYLGLHMDTLLKSNREFGIHMSSKINETSMVGFQHSTANATETLDSTSHNFNYRMQTIFYRHTIKNGWFFSLQFVKRDAHQKIGIIAAGNPNGDALTVFQDRMDIDSESYLLGASLGYEYSFGNNLFLDLTAVSYSSPVFKRHWSTLEVNENSNTSGLQKVRDDADQFAKNFSEKAEFGFMKISFGAKF